MLTGKVPFDDPSAMSVALKHLQDPPPLPSLYNANLSPAIEHVVLRILDKDPNRRYATGAELTAALESAIENESLPSTSKIPVAAIRAALKADADTETPLPSPLHPNPLPPTSSAAAAPAPTTGATAPWPPAEVPPPPTILPVTAVGADQPGATPVTKPAQRRSPLLLGLVLLALIGGALLIARGAGLIGVAATQAATSASTPSVVALVPSEVSTAMATGTLDTTGTEAASATASATHLDTVTTQPSPSESETTTPTLSPTDIPIPSATPTESTLSSTLTATTEAATSIMTAAATEVSATSAPPQQVDVLLVYDKGQIDLINKTAHAISVKNITFVQNGTDARSFDGAVWAALVGDNLQPGACYQAIQFPPPPTPPSALRDCGSRAAYQAVGPTRQFWVASANSSATSFDVKIDNVTVVTCAIAAGRCSFPLPDA
jgi:hypothetical protein